MDNTTNNWTKQQEVALNVFVDFMANILEKYGPMIDDQIEKNCEKSKCIITCSLERLFLLLTGIIVSYIMMVG